MVLNKGQFCTKSPGRKPKRSPASTAGLVNIILSFFLHIIGLHHAMDKNVFPVPAGPMPKTRSDLKISSQNFFWFWVLIIFLFYFEVFIFQSAIRIVVDY